jgi:leucyl-tRNA synthetase
MSSSSYQRRQSAQRRSELAAKAHHLRHNPTATEQLLWRELCGSRLGVAFRRQVVITRFIADLVCPSRRLVIEVDGGVHADRARLDALRDDHLRRAGYRVVHIPAELVRSNLPAAVALVRAAL